MDLKSAYEDSIKRQQEAERAKAVNYDAQLIKIDAVNNPAWIQACVSDFPVLSPSIELSAEEQDAIAQFISLVRPDLWLQCKQVITPEEIEVTETKGIFPGYFYVIPKVKINFQYTWPDGSMHLLRFSSWRHEDVSVKKMDVLGLTSNSKKKNIQEIVCKGYMDRYSNFLSRASSCQEYVIFEFYNLFSVILFKDGHMYQDRFDSDTHFISHMTPQEYFHKVLSTEELLVGALDNLNKRGNRWTL